MRLVLRHSYPAEVLAVPLSRDRRGGDGEDDVLCPPASASDGTGLAGSELHAVEAAFFCALVAARTKPRPGGQTGHRGETGHIWRLTHIISQCTWL